VANRRVPALLDTGSEISIINAEIAQRARDLGIYPMEEKGEIHLADGTQASIPGRISLRIGIQGRTMRHTFSILPTLDSPVLIGADLWARLGLAIPPPPRDPPTARTHGRVAAGMTPRDHDEDARLQEFLRTELAAFDLVKGPTDQIEHVIRVNTAYPIKQRYRPRNPAMQKIIDDEVQDMLQNDVIEPSSSPWSSPVVIVRKKDGRPRFCIDFRKVNEVTEHDAYPLPQVHATLDKLRGARYLTTLDLQQGYWQIPLAAESRPVTAFTVPGRGLMQFKVMPFGLHSAPATFQRLLDKLLGPELEPHVFIYLDDIIIVSATFDEHLQHLAEVFRRLRNARLRLNPEKCHFCRSELKYLGHIIDQQGIRTDPEKVKANKCPSSPSIRGARILVPPVYIRVFRNRRTADETYQEECPLAVGGGGGARLPDLERVTRDVPYPRMPRFQPPFHTSDRRQYYGARSCSYTAFRGRRAGHRLRQPDAQWGRTKL